MRDDRPYPHEIHEDWQRAVDLSDLSLHDAESVMQVVHYVQPPLCAEALHSATEMYQLDHGKCELSVALRSLATSGFIETSRPSNTGTFYPLFFAMTNPRFLGRNTCQAASLGRQLLSDWFSEARDEIKTSRSNFYSHILAVRHVLMAVINADWEVKDNDITPETFFRSAIESDALYTQRRSILGAYEIFAEISSGNLSPGELIRSSPDRKSGKARKRRKKTDPWHVARVEKLAASPPPPRVMVTQLTDPRESENEDELATEASAYGFRPVKISSTTAGNEENGELPTLQRQTPSALTPQDDRRLVQRWMASAPTSSLAAESDMARLTPDQVREVLVAPLQPLERTLAILLLSTGMPVNRLVTMTVSSAGRALPTEKNDRPIWYPERSELCYRLLDGPSARADGNDMTWLRLRLPDALAETLSNPELSTPGNGPFRGMRTRLNRTLARHFRHCPGITPTANRLSATSWLWRRPHATDDVAAATLAGQFGLALSAPAAYRQLTRHEIQRVFEATLESLGLGAVSAQSDFKDPTPDLSERHARIGSAVAQPPETFTAIFTELREAMADPAEAVAGWWVGRPFPRESFAALYQYVAAYHLLAWQLSTGARPIGPTSQNRLGEDMQWIRDKNSARGIESRVVPLHGEIYQGLAQLSRWTDAVRHRVQEQGLMLVDQRSGRLSTPAWLIAPQRGNRLLMRDMTWSDLQSLSLQHTAGLANNVARHSLASWLREQAPDAQVDTLLGHARDGRSLSSPRAAAAMGQLPELRRLLSEWLHECGFRQLNWERLPWKS